MPNHPNCSKRNRARPDLYLTTAIDGCLIIHLQTQRAIDAWYDHNLGFLAFIQPRQPKTVAEHNAAIREFIEREGLRAEDGEL